MHCRGTKHSTKNLEELIDLVSFDNDSSSSLRDAVKFIKPLQLDTAVYKMLNFVTRYETLNLCFLWQLQWKQWLMAWTAKESHGSVDGDTSLLFVRTIEIVSGRIASTEQKLNRWDYSQLEQLTSSICRKLAAKVHAQVRMCTFFSRKRGFLGLCIRTMHTAILLTK